MSIQPLVVSSEVPAFDMPTKLADCWDHAARRYAVEVCKNPVTRIVGKKLAVPRGASVRSAVSDALIQMDCDVAVLQIDLDRMHHSHARDQLTTAVFTAGYECPLIWAHRDILLAEPTRKGPISRLLSDIALGNPEACIAGDEIRLSLKPGSATLLAKRRTALPPSKRRWKLSVVMPVYNEKATFKQVIAQLLALSIPNFDIEICLVESNSKDGTRDDVLLFAEHPKVKLLLEDKPSGKGHAVRAGLGLATGDVIIIQDADLEYDIGDYPRLLAPIVNHEASFVLGSRHPAGENRWQIRSFVGQERVADVMNLGHLFFTWLLNTTFRQRLRDPFTMYKVFRRDVIWNAIFESNRFDFDIELAGKLIRLGLHPLEVDVRYVSRSFDQGKKVSFLGDPPTWVRACCFHRFSRLYAWPGTSGSSRSN